MHPDERVSIAKVSFSRMIEMSLLGIASPFFSRKRIKRLFHIDPSCEKFKSNLLQGKKATIALMPHLSLAEAISLFPALLTNQIPETGVFYRPFNNPTIERWIKKARQRFGVTMLSRKEGFVKGLKILRNKGTIGLLFDQNAGHKGTLSLFFDRIVSSAEIHGVLGEKCTTDIAMLYIRRTGFWTGCFEVEYLHCADTRESIITAANNWLEEKLKKDRTIREDWLWAHNRWRCQDEPHLRLRLEAKKSILSHYTRPIPRRTSFFIRIPNWLGDVVMMLPLLRSLRAGRPDAHITIIGKKHLFPLIQALHLAEEFIELPNKDWKYFFTFWKLRKRYPETHILFTNSFRADLEAFLIGAPQRFGIAWPNNKRRFLSHTWKLPTTTNLKEVHQTQIWEQFLTHFGIKTPIDYSPFDINLSRTKHTFKKPPIGLICGTENSPEKRWPEHLWQDLIIELIDQDPDRQYILFGTSRDKPITVQVSTEFSLYHVLDLAGRTDLLEFATLLKQCELIVCNDTGGMHLANALGVPTVGIFGPTNPIRTGPIFDSPYAIIQPSNCPPTGGCKIQNVSPLDVLAKIREIQARGCAP